MEQFLRELGELGNNSWYLYMGNSIRILHDQPQGYFKSCPLIEVACQRNKNIVEIMHHNPTTFFMKLGSILGLWPYQVKSIVISADNSHTSPYFDSGLRRRMLEILKLDGNTWHP